MVYFSGSSYWIKSEMCMIVWYIDWIIHLTLFMAHIQEQDTEMFPASVKMALTLTFSQRLLKLELSLFQCLHNCNFC